MVARDNFLNATPDIWICLPQWISYIYTKFRFLHPH